MISFMAIVRIPVGHSYRASSLQQVNPVARTSPARALGNYLRRLKSDSASAISEPRFRYWPLYSLTYVTRSKKRLSGIAND